MSYEERGRPAAPARKPHTLAMEARRQLTLSGVEEVESFDENEISMRTGEGDLIVRGEGLRVDRLNVEGGDVNILGSISELRYAERAPEKSFWARLWR
jgi:sporulation protein YabP